MKTPKNNNSSLEEQEFFKKMGMTVEEGEAWMEASGNAWQEEDKPSGYDSNVLFVPGESTMDTKIYVNGALMSGVIAATLHYDTQDSIPILTLQVRAFKIGQN